MDIAAGVAAVPPCVVTSGSAAGTRPAIIGPRGRYSPLFAA